MSTKSTYLFLFFIFISSVSIAQDLQLDDCFLEYKRRETRYITEDQYGFIWMMRSDGFFRYDGKEMEFIDIAQDMAEPFFHSAGIILPMSNGDYWFAARDAGLLVYRAAEDRFYRANIPSLKDSTKTSYIRSIEIYPYKEDKMIVGSSDGFHILDKHLNEEKFVRPLDYYKNDIPNRIREGHGQIRKIVYDTKNDIVWLGGILGLFSYNPRTEEIKRHPVTKNGKLLNNNRDSYLINDIWLDGDQLIAGSWHGGLMTYDIASDEWQSFVFESERDLPQKSGTTQVAETPGGRIFIAHERTHMATWRRELDYLQPVTVDGNRSREGIGALVDRLGYLWIGHWSYICRYVVPEEPPVAKPSQIYIKQIRLDSTIVRQRMNRWDHQSFHFSQSGKQLQIQFRAINPLSYDEIKYEYRMQGLHEHWIANDASEFATFAPLAEGKYTFQVRFVDPVSKEYVYSGEVAIEYKPEYVLSKNTLLGIIGLLLLSILTFFVYRYYMKRKQALAIERYEAKLREVQDAALRSQMNPHFLFNSLNSIRYFIVTSDNKKAADYLTRFSRLIRMILEHSKQQLVPLMDELQLLELYVNMEQVRFDGKFEFVIKKSDDFDLQQIMVPPMLIQPYIENAILHGINPKEGPGKIVLDISKSDGLLLLKIIDDGIGRQKSQALKSKSVLKKKSLGMDITKTRLSLTDSATQQARLQIIDLVDEEGVGCGTEVRIWLPLK